MNNNGREGLTLFSAISRSEGKISTQSQCAGVSLIYDLLTFWNGCMVACTSRECLSSAVEILTRMNSNYSSKSKVPVPLNRKQS